MIATRSPAERRALLWCLSVGLLAIALGTISLLGELPHLLDVFSDGYFWGAAGITAVDAVLVLVGCRGPRFEANAAAFTLVMLLALLLGFGLLESWATYILGASRSTSDAIQLLAGYGLMSVVQWLSFKAARERFQLSKAGGARQ
jgi:hypothetical protein